MISKIISQLKQYAENPNFTDVLMVLVGKTCNYLLFFILAFFFIRKFGEVQYGIFVVTFSVARISSVILNFGNSNKTLKEVTGVFEDNPNTVSRVISDNLIIVMFTSLVLSLTLFSLYWIGTFLGIQLDIFPLLFLVLVFRVFNDVFIQIYRGIGKIVHFSFAEIPITILLILGGLFFHDEIVPYTAFLILLFAWSIGLLLHVFFLWKYFSFSNVTWNYIKEKIQFFFSSKKVKESFLVSQNNIIALSGQFAVPVILNIFRVDPSMISTFDIVYRLSSFSTFLMKGTNSIVGPKSIIAFKKNKHKEFYIFAKKISRIILLFSIPYMIGIILIGQIILSTFFGITSQEGLFALIILTAGFQFHAICGSNEIVMNLTGYEEKLRNIFRRWFFGFMILLCVGIPIFPNSVLLLVSVIHTIYLCSWNIDSLLFLKRTHGYSTIYIPFSDSLNR